MALHALAQCTARLLLSHQQKQGRQRAVITSRDSEEEEEGMRKDWSVYCALADLGTEERVNGGWYVCILRYRLIDILLSCVLRHSGPQGCTVWSLSVLHDKMRIDPSRRRSWRRQIRFSRKGFPSC
ncbi:hypothetical protein V8E52_004371 [Russula decolorans]